MKDRCYIFGAGEYRGIEISEKLHGLIIAADGGFLFLQKKGIMPDLLVGDFDSFEEYDEENGKPGTDMLSEECILRHPPEKDDNDMMLAVKEGMKRGCKEFFIYGGLGGRLDHTIANIQTLQYIAGQGLRGYLVGGKETITVICDDCLIIPEEKQKNSRYLSVFCLGDQAKGVTLRNLKYVVEDATLTKEFPLGVSNEFTGKTAEICMEKGSLLVIWKKDELVKMTANFRLKPIFFSIFTSNA